MFRKKDIAVAREIRLNAFVMNCVGHQSPGLWTHPRDRSSDYNRLPYWLDLARILERGRFDGMFLADVLGTYDVFGGTPDAALRNAAQVPVNDPMMLISAMAAVTENLGFGVTCTLSYEPPFPFARRMSTLDHLTEGRIGWNIVTGYLNSAAKGMGKSGQTSHDARYDVADEYMEVVYKLWEGSWDDDAVLRDRETRAVSATTQGKSGSTTIRSAGAPTARRPDGRPRISAGRLVIARSTVSRSASPACTRRKAAASKVSSPIAPSEASAKGWRFTSLSCGSWAE